MGRNGKNSDQSRLDALAAGLRKHFAGETLQIGGKQVIVADALGLFSSLDAEVAKTKAARIAWSKQVAAERKLRNGQALPVANEIIGFLRAHFGPGSPWLLDFGLRPRKRAKV